MAARKRFSHTLRARRNRAAKPCLDVLELRTSPAASIFNPAPGMDTLRAAIAQAESDSSSTDVINLSAGIYSQSQAGGGQVVIQDMDASVAGKTLIIAGAGATESIVQPASSGFRNFEVVGKAGATVTVVFRDVSIREGDATDGGTLGGAVALGGGILIEGGNVTLSNVSVSGNHASGAAGGQLSNGSHGGNAEGGGIYVAAGALTAVSSKIVENSALGGAGGTGVKGTIAGGDLSHGLTGTDGKNAAMGHPGANGKIGADGGPGGSGGSGLDGGLGGDAPANGMGGAGGDGGDGSGGGIYVAGGTVTLINTTLNNNHASGGVGGQGGAGGGYLGFDGYGGPGGDGGNGGAGARGGAGGHGDTSSGGPGGRGGAGGNGGPAGDGGPGGDGAKGGDRRARRRRWEWVGRRDLRRGGKRRPPRRLAPEQCRDRRNRWPGGRWRESHPFWTRGRPAAREATAAVASAGLIPEDRVGQVDSTPRVKASEEVMAVRGARGEAAVSVATRGQEATAATGATVATAARRLAVPFTWVEAS